MRYLLKDDGYPTFKKIVSGRKWIGRVCKTEFGHYLGIIGSISVKAPTERAAFDEVVAKHCGFESVAALNDKNARVRAGNAKARQAARFVVSEMLAGNYEPFGDMLERLDKENGEDGS